MHELRSVASLEKRRSLVSDRLSDVCAYRLEAVKEAARLGKVTLLAGVRIVVVDDDVQVLGVLQAILSRAGALVTAVDSAANAFAALGEVDADILISDIVMPGDDGYALMRRIRAASGRKQRSLPAIALTGYVDDAAWEKMNAAGFTVYLRKPMLPAELVRRVAELLTSRLP